jgi:hypothetical protein
MCQSETSIKLHKFLEHIFFKSAALNNFNFYQFHRELNKQGISELKNRNDEATPMNLQAEEIPTHK